MTEIGTVLLLEDEGIIVIDMEDMLLASGVQRVVCLDTCEAATEWLAISQPDLAVIDPRLKDGPCATVARHIVAKGIPFVVYSGDVGAAVEIDTAFRKGVALSKPAGPEQVLSAITAALSAAAV